MFCKGSSVARKRYERDVIRLMVVYAVLLCFSLRFLRHAGLDRFALYFWSVLPAIPVVGVIARMARYLQEETDEYQRLMAIRAVLVGTAALLGTIVVTDFMRNFAKTEALPPFIGFLIFCAGTAIAQREQTLRNRVPADE